VEVTEINNYQEQSIIFYTVKEIIELLKDKENINYKTIGIKLHQKFILSQIMYLKSKIVRRPYKLLVQKDTYNKEFQKIIHYLLEDIVVKQTQLGNSNITIIAHLRKAASFVNWSQAENINILSSKNSALEAYGLYTKFLKDNIKKGLSQGDASIKHAASLKLLKSIHLDHENYISSGIRAISNISTYKYLEKSDEYKQKYQFKEGSIAYKEIVIGGCISTEACDFMLTRLIVACSSCDSSIIKKSKLDNLILKQKRFIEYLDKKSPDYRTEIADLKILEDQRKLFLGSKA